MFKNILGDYDITKHDMLTRTSTFQIIVQLQEIEPYVLTPSALEITTSESHSDQERSETNESSSRFTLSDLTFSPFASEADLFFVSSLGINQTRVCLCLF